jgi:hypothetical protein
VFSSSLALASLEERRLRLLMIVITRTPKINGHEKRVGGNDRRESRGSLIFEDQLLAERATMRISIGSYSFDSDLRISVL